MAPPHFCVFDQDRINPGFKSRSEASLEGNQCLVKGKVMPAERVDTASGGKKIESEIQWTLDIEQQTGQWAVRKLSS